MSPSNVLSPKKGPKPVVKVQSPEEPSLKSLLAMERPSFEIAGFESERNSRDQLEDSSASSLGYSQSSYEESFTEDDDPEGGPKWMSAKKVTADPTRELELGAGKWGEARGNLDQDILRAVMSDNPVRELEIEDGGSRWGLLLVGVIIFVVILVLIMS